MRLRIASFAATVGASLALAVVPAAPAAAYHYDCEFMGTEFLVHDTIDCAYWIYLHLVP